MSPPPRRLSFAVSTSLLSASLSLGAAGCDDKQPTVNPAPEKDSDVHVNVDPVTPEGEQNPEPTPETVHTVNPVPEPAPEELHVNEGPEPAPQPTVNTVPDPKAKPPTSDKAPPEEKHVNTRPDDKP